MTSYSCKHLTNTTLLSSLGELVQHGRRNMAQLLAHLAEVNDRKLYLEQGCSSLFTYAVERLRFSEDEAAKRIHAARAAREYPVIFELVAEGALHLSAVTLLAPHLTSENHASLLEKARGRTKRQVEEIVAAHAPRPDSPTRLWKLPSLEAAHAPEQVSAPSLVTPVNQDVASVRAPLPLPATPRPEVTPLSKDRYRFLVTLSANAKQLLLRAQDLMRHQNPSGDLEVVIEQALSQLVAQLESRKLGKRRRRGSHAPESPEHPLAPPAPEAQHAPEHPLASPAPAVPEPLQHAPEHAPTPRTRHIPAAIRRAVSERDGDRCSYVSRDGHRCSARGFLELHHLVPFARGGASTLEGLALRCRAHNAYEAELDFGVDHIRRARASATSPAATETPPPGS